MLGEAVQGRLENGSNFIWFNGGRGPNVQEVVVAPACQVLAVRGPLQTAHFLFYAVVRVVCNGGGRVLLDGGNGWAWR